LGVGRFKKQQPLRENQHSSVIGKFADSSQQKISMHYASPASKPSIGNAQRPNARNASKPNLFLGGPPKGFIPNRWAREIAAQRRQRRNKYEMLPASLRRVSRIERRSGMIERSMLSRPGADDRWISKNGQL
jgi:hypothetical protein